MSWFFFKKKKSVWALKKIIFKPDLKVKFHYNIAFSHNFVPIISKPTNARSYFDKLFL